MQHDPGEMNANWGGYWFVCSCGYKPRAGSSDLVDPLPTRQAAKKDIALHLKHAEEEKLWYVVNDDEISRPFSSKREAYVHADVKTGTLLAPGVYSVGAHVFVTRFPDLCLV